jgi:diacylglycerol kinase family enzyme
MEHGGAISEEAMEELKHLKKSDPRKVVCAALVKRRTSVSNDWFAERLAMGHPASMSQHVNRMRKESKAAKRLNQHDKALKSKDCPGHET